MFKFVGAFDGEQLVGFAQGWLVDDDERTDLRSWLDRDFPEESFSFSEIALMVRTALGTL